MKKRYLILTAVCVLISSIFSWGNVVSYGHGNTYESLAAADEWFPFTIPWDDSADTAVNVGKLVLDAPAGKHGFLSVRDGHFYFDNGTRIRFWGTNLSQGANFPTHEDAEKIAAHMAKFGFNIVRLHHMDSNYAPNGIFNKTEKNTQTLDEEQLDRLDYLIYQLKKKGIYVDINLHVGRKFTDGDGVTDAKNLPRNSKQVTLFDETLINLEKDYAQKLLTHYNPYTKSTYNNEPCVALVETTNENSLFTAWTNGALFGKTDEALPQYYRDELDLKFNQWLNNKYGSTDALKSAWNTDEMKVEGQNLVSNGDFSDSVENSWVKEVHKGYKAEFSTEDGCASINVTTPGQVQSDIQFKQLGIKLEKDKNYTLSFKARSDSAQDISVSFGMEKSPWKNYGLSGKVSLTENWNNYTLNFTANSTTDENTRLSFVIGKASGAICIDDVSLKETGVDGLSENESLENGNIERTKWESRSTYTKQRLSDNTEFYYNLESDFFKDMNSYIHNDLGIKVPVSTSNNYNGNADLMAQNEGDYIDTHGYWDHPSFPGVRFDKKNFKQTNLSLVSSNSFIFSSTSSFNSSPIIRYSMSSIGNKPLVISEWNDVFPNDYDYEEAGIIASYSLLQDWDGLFIYTYNSSRDTWNSGKVNGWFDISNNSGKMSQMPACALAFIRGDFNKANETIALAYSKKDVLADFINKAGSVNYNLKGTLPTFMPYIHQVRKTGFDSEKTSNSENLISAETIDKITKQKVLKSDTGEISWYNNEKGKEYVTFDSPKSKGAVGFLSGKNIKLNGLELNNVTDSSIFLTSIDGKGMENSGKMLLTAVASQKNTDEEKNEQKGLANWGTAPVLMEPVTGTLKINVTGDGKDYRVYALDSSGNRKGQIETISDKGSIEFTLGNYGTTWYEITK